jgi:hypothetical protein
MRLLEEVCGRGGLVIWTEQGDTVTVLGGIIGGFPLAAGRLGRLSVGYGIVVRRLCVGYRFALVM